MTLLLLAVVAVTSLLAVAALGRGRVGEALAALGMVLEAIGATVGFFVANLTAGVALVLVARAVSLFYATLYEVADVTLPIMSLIQALTITLWRVRIG
ncbi:MAG: hypothetical protein FJZ38_16920 [Candidatus Rokubacteria bacterium]|nr:hypothetical protein [Candidatus Rokubacteria bacterium]